MASVQDFSQIHQSARLLENVRSPELSGPEANLATPLPPNLQVWLGANLIGQSLRRITQLQVGNPRGRAKPYEYEWKIHSKHDTPDRPVG